MGNLKGGCRLLVTSFVSYLRVYVSVGTNFAVLLQEPLDINQQTLAFLSVYCTFLLYGKFQNGTQRIRFMYHV